MSRKVAFHKKYLNVLEYKMSQRNGRSPERVVGGSFHGITLLYTLTDLQKQS